VPYYPPSGGGGAPSAHATTHQDNGSDEINVTGLTGLLGTAQTPAAHTHPESDVTNLVSDLGGKQATLVSATNIKTINGSTLLGSGDLVVTGSAATFNPNLQTSAADQTIPALSSVFLYKKYILTGTAKHTNHGFLLVKN